MPSLRPFVPVKWQQLAAWLRKGDGNRLLIVNTGVCSGLYALGDVCQQKLTGSGTNDWARNLRMATLGLLMGPVNHYWYVALDFVMPGRAGKTVFKKVLADQLVMAPVCCVLFYTGMCFLERKTSRQAMGELKVKFWPTYKMDCTVWPAAQVVNFYFVPPAWRVTYNSVMTFLWTVFLSYMKHVSKGSHSSMIHPCSSPSNEEDT